MSVVVRTLPPEENYRAIEAGGPLAEVGATAEKLAQMSIAVVEVDDHIVAYWVLWYALHIEPLWIHPGFRRSPQVVTGIISEMQRVAEATPEPAAFAILEREQVAQLGAAALRLGFHEAPGKLYYVLIQAPATDPVPV